MAGKTILFICKGNSGRSQMAEAFFNATSKGWRAISAGTEPDPKIHPWTVEIMGELGFDLSSARTKPATQKMMKKADKIILMDSDLLTFIPRDIYPHVEIWNIEKLYGKTIEEVRQICKVVRARVELLAAGLPG
jgi:arsenate reductase